MKIEKEDLITDITAIFLPRILVALPPSLNLVASSSHWTVCQSQQHGPTGILPFSSRLQAPSQLHSIDHSQLPWGCSKKDDKTER